jgi:hypothetical protein
VTEFEGAETGPTPFGFEAWTVNVYVDAGSRFGIVAVVAGGEPVTMVAACAVDPMYGVIV